MWDRIEKPLLWMLVICFGLMLAFSLTIMLKTFPEQTLTCDDKLIVKSNSLYIDNNMWVWNNGTYTPEGGEICVLIKGEDK